MIVTFLPAAGASRRMKGRDKLLEPVDGRPLLRRAAETALAAGLGPVLVGLRPDHRARQEALKNLAVGILEVPDAGQGLSASLRSGAEAALAAIDAAAPAFVDDEYSGMLVLLPDMPDLEATDLAHLARVFQARGGPVVRGATADGRPGHPVLFPRSLLHDFNRLTGDAGAAGLLEGERVLTVPLAGDRALTDLDTAEDWARWRDEPRPSST